MVILVVGSEARSAEQSYERRFSDLLVSGVYGFVSDPALVDTNNDGPILRSGPISFSGFARAGEFGGIRLGMTMSEVVAAWGKPRGLYTHCGPGPRFYYTHSVFLFFRDERLVRIFLTGELLRGLVFDNGLMGTMGSTQVESTVGYSLVRRNEKDLLSYGFEGFHLDFAFDHVPRTPTSAWQKEEMSAILLGRGDEPRSGRLSEQNAAPNAAPPHR